MKMCTSLLACPLCCQKCFASVDALRTGLVSIATRPLSCPVCSEMLIGMEKLTIHLFSHTIAQNCNNINNSNINNDSNDNNNAEQPVVELTSEFAPNVRAVVCNNRAAISVETWNALNLGALETKDMSTQNENNVKIDERNPHLNGPSTDRILFLESIGEPKVQSSNLESMQVPMNIFPLNNNQACISPDKQESYQSTAVNAPSLLENRPGAHIEASENDSDMQGSWMEERSSIEHSPNSQFPQSHTDILADLVRNTQITASPLGEFQDCGPNCSCPLPECLTEKATAESSEKPLPKVKSVEVLPDNQRAKRCDICGFYFSDHGILLLHKQIVHMVAEKDLNKSPGEVLKSFNCHLCSKVFKMRGSLMVHMRVAHSSVNSVVSKKDKEKPFYSNNQFCCPICHKGFKKEQLVNQHMKIHDDKQWECETCSKRFSTKYFLKKHKRLHSGEMPYKCNLCDKTFTFQQSFHKHKFYHRDDKPYVCLTCGRSFKELSTLHNHERIHTGEKPFTCETCGKCFRQRVSYLVHRRIHTGDMPYKCSLCGRTFRYKISMRTHRCSVVAENELQSEALVKELLSAVERQQRVNGSAEEKASVGRAPDETDNNRYIYSLDDQTLRAISSDDLGNDKQVGQELWIQENAEDDKKSMPMLEVDESKVSGSLKLWSSTDSKQLANLSDLKNLVVKKEECPNNNGDLFNSFMAPVQNGDITPTALDTKQAEKLTPRVDSVFFQSHVTENGRKTNAPQQSANCISNANGDSLSELLYSGKGNVG